MVLENLKFSLNATMPLFIMIMLGYLLKRINMINEETSIGLNKLVYKFFLPILLFYDLAKQDFKGLWDTSFVLYCFLVTLASIFIAFLLSKLDKDKIDRGEIIQGAYRSGAASLGIAFMTNIYSNASMVALMIVASVPLYNIAAVIILSFTSPDHYKSMDKKIYKKTLINICKNPIIIGVVLGAVWGFIGIPQAAILSKTLSSLSNVASPLALVALGASVDFVAVKEKIKPVILVIFCKLFLFCGIFLPIAISMGFRNEKLVAILIMLGSATTSSSFIMAKNMGHEGIISSSAVMLTTLFSSFTLTFWLFLLRSWGFV